MSVIELNELVLQPDKEVIEYPLVTEEELSEFMKILEVSSVLKASFEQEEDANNFFKSYPQIKSLLNKDTAVDIFYACKMQFYFKGVPNKIVFIMKKAIERFEDKKLPNHIMEMCETLLKPYADKKWVSEAGEYTLKDILESVCSQSVTLITHSNYKVSILGNAYEVYIPDVERVALLPKDIGDRLTYEDCLDLKYSYELGIHLRNEPLRTINKRLGIIFDDFNLLETL